jgi:hypothetical protein
VDVQLIQDNLENLGELAVYDLLLGNFDRFHLESSAFNSGNIMFQEGVLHAIDTDCCSDPLSDDDEMEKFETSKLILKKIIQGRGDFDHKIAMKLANNLGGVEKKEDLFSKEKIKIGMDRAISRLTEFTKNIDTNKEFFMKSCQERGRESSGFPKFVEELLLYISNLKK